MADEKDITMEEQKAKAAFEALQREQTRANDLAKTMVETLKSLNAAKGKELFYESRINEFSKSILANAQARGMMESKIQSDIEDSQRAILKLKAEHLNYEDRLLAARIKASEAQKDLDNKELVALIEEQKINGIIEDQNNLISVATRAYNEARERGSMSELDHSRKIIKAAEETIIRNREKVDLAKQEFENAKETLKISNETVHRINAQQKDHEKLLKDQEEMIANNYILLAQINSQLNKDKKKLDYAGHLKDTSRDILKIFGNFGDVVGNFANKIKAIPPHFLLIDAIIFSAIDRFVELDKMAEKFREQTGFSVQQMIQLRSDVESVNRAYEDMGVEIEQAYGSAKALTDVFGRTSLVTKDLIGNVALLSANLGVSANDSAAVLANFQGLGDASSAAAMNVIKVGAGISDKAGVPFKFVMQDIANATDQTITLIGTAPSKLIKSAIAARALGVDMNKIAGAQKQLLNYSSSINDELEASALLGRSLSFQKARQLAYEGDIEGAAKATLETVKRAGDFNKMNVYQREALAKASGMELKDLTKMMAVEKQRDEILMGNDESKKEILRKQDEELAKLKKIADLDDADLVKQNEKVLMQQKMQGILSNLANTFQSIFVSVADVFEPIVRVTVLVLVPIFKIMAAIIRGMLKPIINIGQALLGNSEKTQKFADVAMKVSKAMGTVYEWSEKTGEMFTKIMLPLVQIFATFELITGTVGRFTAYTRNLVVWFLEGAKVVRMFGDGLKGIFTVFKPITTIVSSILKGFSTFAKFLGPIGLVISAIQVAVEFAGELIDIISSDEMSLGDKILASLAAIPKVLYNVFIKPFVSAIDWVMNYFNVGFTLTDILNEMWKNILDFSSYFFTPIFEAWNKVTEIFSGDGSIGERIVSGLQAVDEGIRMALLAPFKWAWDKISGWLGQSPSELGEGIVTGIKAVGSMLLDALTFPFRTAMNFISGLFGGDGQLGTLIVQGIKKAASFIFDIITSPFKKAFEFVGGLIGKVFGGNDVGKQVSLVQSSSPVSSVIEVNHLDELRDVIGELVEAVGNLGTSTTQTVVGGTINTSALEAKLDNLTNLLVGGAVRVYLDGKDVSAAMTGIGR